MATNSIHNHAGVLYVLAAAIAIMVMLDLCQDRPRCSVLASPDTFLQDPCEGTSKYLVAHYQCKPDVFETETVCEGDTLDIKCQDGDRLVIDTAMFGRTVNGTSLCPANKQGQIDCISDAKTITLLQKECQGLKSCNMLANVSTFVDPCPPGVNKYLTVTYACVPRKFLKSPRKPSGKHKKKRKRKKKKKKKKNRKKKGKKKNRKGSTLTPEVQTPPVESSSETSTAGKQFELLEGGDVTTEEIGELQDIESSTSSESSSASSPNSSDHLLPIITTSFEGFNQSVSESSTIAPSVYLQPTTEEPPTQQSIYLQTTEETNVTDSSSEIKPEEHFQTTTPMLPLNGVQRDRDITSDSRMENAPESQTVSHKSVPKDKDNNEPPVSIGQNITEINNYQVKKDSKSETRDRKSDPKNNKKALQPNQGSNNRIINFGRAKDPIDTTEEPSSSNSITTPSSNLQKGNDKKVGMGDGKKDTHKKDLDGKGTKLVTHRNLTVLCANYTVSPPEVATRRFDRPRLDRGIGFLKDWFSIWYFLENHQEKAWLYFTLGICFGIIVLLIIILVKVCINFKRNIRARLDVSEPTHRSALINNHSTLDAPMLEHSDSIDRIEVVRFSPRGTLRSMRSSSQNRDIVNYYG